MKRTSIIIVSYNSESTIKACLLSVVDTPDAEIIVVDNNSVDGTLKEVEKFKEVVVIKNSKNLGFGRANNLGVKNSTGEFIFFLNPDCIAEKQSTEKLLKFLSSHPEVGAVGPKLLNGDGSILREMSPFPTLLSEIFVLLRLHRIPVFQNLVYPNYDYSREQEAEHLMGAALMVPRNVFEKVGGFDENFFLWFEETDLLKRIKEAGYKIFYLPEASVKHLVGQSTKQVNRFQRQAIWNKSLIYFFRKHKNPLQTLILFPFILLSYPAALVVSFIKD